MNMNHATIVIGALLSVLIGCAGSVKNDTPLPNSIQDLQLVEVFQGEVADQMIRNLHQKEVTTASNYIGKYTNKEYDATLYLTVYEDTSRANDEFGRMRDRIMNPDIGGQMGFQHIRRLDTLGDNVYMALQNQRAHYFYLDLNKLFWMDVHPQVAMASIKQLLNK